VKEMNEKLMIEQEEGWTRRVKSKKLNAKLVPVLAASTLSVMVIAGGLGFAWADTGSNNGITIKATDAIKNDPTAIKVLENIEWFKQRWVLQQQVQQLQDQQNQFIDQQRALANAYLQSDLARMSNTKDQTSPQNAFVNFVSTINSPAQNVFLDEFSYMQEKVQQARDVKNQVLQNGGSIDQALQAFNNAAAIRKTELVSVNNQLNIKYSFADQKVQSLFDKWGNIPRN
jgi:hypothetical protein